MIIILLQVNISLAILFATEGFYPKNEEGVTISTYQDLNSALPLITFVLSIFSSSFGMSKFFIAGPIQFISGESAFNGLISVPFMSLCIINSMFGFRVVCVESAFFTSYRIQSDNETTGLYDLNQISPIISPEYRLLVYLAPCIIPFLINVFKLFRTTKGLREYLMKYPQFLVSPCFTPFMFEGYELNNNQGQYKLRIWKWGTIINAIYIGCIPQCILCFTDYYKDVHNWEFGEIPRFGSVVGENNDALFKSPYGNTIFATISAISFLALITLFFGSESIFGKRGIHCRILTILCWPSPNPCISYTDHRFESTSESNPSNLKDGEKNVEETLLTEQPSINMKRPPTEVYIYSKHGESKTRLLGPSQKKKHDMILQVKYFHSSLLNIIVLFIFTLFSTRLEC